MPNPFTNVNIKPLKTREDIDAFGALHFENLERLSAGRGDETMKFDYRGLWLGNENFEDAPFRVDLQGNVTASSISLSGYIQTGGAAADVNAGSTAIAPGLVQVEGSTTLANWASSVLGNIYGAGAIESAVLGSTIILGGYVRTTLLDVNDIFSQNITATGTITGPTIQTASSGNRIRIHHETGLGLGSIDFLFNNSVRATLRTTESPGSAGAIIDASGNAFLQVVSGSSLVASAIGIDGGPSLSCVSDSRGDINWSSVDFFPTTHCHRSLGGTAGPGSTSYGWFALRLCQDGYISRVHGGNTYAHFRLRNDYTQCSRPIVLPSYTDALMPSGVDGMLVYRTDPNPAIAGTYQYHNGNWERLHSG